MNKIWECAVDCCSEEVWCNIEKEEALVDGDKTAQDWDGRELDNKK